MLWNNADHSHARRQLGTTREGAKAIGKALAVNGMLNNIDLRHHNDLGDEGEGVIRDAVSGREGFTLLM